MKNMKDSGVAAIICLIVAASVAINELVIPLAALISDNAVWWTTPTEHTAQGLAWAETQVNLMTISSSLWVWVLVRGLIITIFAVGAMYFLGKVLVAVARGKSFAKNHSKLLLVAASLIFVIFLILFTDGFINARVAHELYSSDAMWLKRFTGVELLLLAISSLIAGMADAFSRGWLLKQDTEGLI